MTKKVIRYRVVNLTAQGDFGFRALCWKTKNGAFAVILHLDRNLELNPKTPRFGFGKRMYAFWDFPDDEAFHNSSAVKSLMELSFPKAKCFVDVNSLLNGKLQDMELQRKAVGSGWVLYPSPQAIFKKHL